MAAAMVVYVPVVIGSDTARAADCGTMLPLAVPACGALWGISVPSGSTATLTADETQVGRKFDLSYHFHQFGDTLPSSGERQEVASGHLLKVNIESSPYSYATIASGSHDAALTKQAAGVKSLNAPVYVSFEHEPDVKTKSSRGTPAQFIAAWRHVHSVFAAAGATNAIWVWITTGYSKNIPTYAGFWPGNDVVDWISWEAYSTTACSTSRNVLTGTFANDAGPMYDWLHDGRAAAAGIDVSKPEMISEYGAVYDSGKPGAQGAWYQGIPQLLATKFPDIKAVTKWDNTGTNCKYQMSASPLTLAGVTAAGHDPYVNQSTVTTPVPPVAKFTPTCANETCNFDASASTAPGSTITGYAWTFGDTTAGTGANPVKTYSGPGSYQVTLTVTSAAGGTGSMTQTITTPPPPPVAAFTWTCSAAACNFDASTSTASESTITAYSWDFSDAPAGSGVTPTHTFSAGGSYPVTLTVTDAAGDTGSVTHQLAVGGAASVAFVASASTTGNASTESVTVPSAVQTGNTMLLVATGASGNALTAPAGWTLVDSATSSSLTTALWRRVATSGDAGSKVSVGFGSVYKGSVQLLAYSGTGATNPVVAYAKKLTASTASSYLSPTTTVPANGDVVVSYWTCKSSSATKWTTPAAQTVRSTAYGTGGGRITSVASDGGPAAAGPAGGLSASPDTSATAFAAWTIVIG